MYERILVPTDGSENSEDAVAHAVDIAGQYGAEIHALYVINTGAVASPEPAFREEFIATGREHGEHAVSAVEAAAAAADVPVATAVIQGTPYEEILDYADEHGIDLIVMGTHGRTGLRHFLLGSVAERVIRHAPVPVLLVRI